jgi:uncharacterized protein YdhG (YjbR/CyaY superfamily)
MLSDIRKYHDDQEEQTREALLYLRKHILNSDKSISEEWKYRLPFFYFKGKMLCYFWSDKKTKLPYIGFMDGVSMDHPALVQSDRKRVKVYTFNPSEDIDIQTIDELLGLALSIKKCAIQK